MFSIWTARVGLDLIPIDNFLKVGIIRFVLPKKPGFTGETLSLLHRTHSGCFAFWASQAFEDGSGYRNIYQETEDL